MGRFAKVWPDELQESIIAARLDKGLTVKAACELAMSGQLDSYPNPGAKVPIPVVKGLSPAETGARLLKNAYVWTSKAKRERVGSDVPEWIAEEGTENVIDRLAKQLVNIAAGEIRKVEKQRVGARDLDRARKAAQMLREARALVRGDAPTRSAKARDAANGKTPEQDGSAESGALGLVAKMRADAKGTHPRQDDRTEGDAEGAKPTAEQQDEESSGGILTGASGEQDEERSRMAAELGIELGEDVGAMRD